MSGIIKQRYTSKELCKNLLGSVIKVFNEKILSNDNILSLTTTNITCEELNNIPTLVFAHYLIGQIWIKTKTTMSVDDKKKLISSIQSKYESLLYPFKGRSTKMIAVINELSNAFQSSETYKELQTKVPPVLNGLREKQSINETFEKLYNELDRQLQDFIRKYDIEIESKKNTSGDLDQKIQHGQGELNQINSGASVVKANIGDLSPERIERLTKEVASKNASLTSLKAELGTVASNIKTANDELERQNSAKETLTNDISKLTSETKGINDDIGNNISPRIQVAEAEHSTLNGQIAALTAQIESLKKTFTEIEKDIRQLNESVTNGDSELHEINEEINKANESLTKTIKEKEQKESELASITANISGLQQEHERVQSMKRNAINALNGREESIKINIDELTKTIESNDTKTAEIRGKIQQITKQTDALNAETARLNKETTESNQKIIKSTENVEELTAQCSQLESNINELTGQIQKGKDILKIS